VTRIIPNVPIVADMLMAPVLTSRSCLMTAATGSGAADFHLRFNLPNMVAR
jgi:hypothetical protein